jgi:hypothetical protein
MPGTAVPGVDYRLVKQLQPHRAVECDRISGCTVIANHSDYRGAPES